MGGRRHHNLRLETSPNVEGFPLFVYCKLSSTSVHCRVISSDFIWSEVGCLWNIEICKEGIPNEFVTDKFNLHLNFETLVGVDMEYQSLSTKGLPPNSDPTSAVASGENLSSLKGDLLLLYRERLHSDKTLKAGEYKFPAHRNILAARSHVFRAMFEKDQMSESLTGVVDIKDVDSKTLDRMLVFLYGESLEDVEWEDALALYYAADKYAVHTLKLRCADILVAGLNVSNVCQILVLADTHVDEKLMEIVVNFIRDHDEVVSSADWAELEDSNPKVTTKIMRELYLSQRSQIQQKSPLIGKRKRASVCCFRNCRQQESL